MNQNLYSLQFDIEWFPVSMFLYLHNSHKSIYEMAVNERKLLPPSPYGYGGLIVSEKHYISPMNIEIHLANDKTFAISVAHESEHAAARIVHRMKQYRKDLWSKRVVTEDEVRAGFTGSITQLFQWFRDSVKQNPNKPQRVPKRVMDAFYTIRLVCFPHSMETTQ